MSRLPISSPEPPRGEGHSPRLRVVSADPARLRRVRTALFVNGSIGISAEIIAEAEWDQLHPSERPEAANLFPGIGYLSLALCVRQLEGDKWRAEREAEDTYLAAEEGGDL